MWFEELVNLGLNERTGVNPVGWTPLQTMSVFLNEGFPLIEQYSWPIACLLQTFQTIDVKLHSYFDPFPVLFPNWLLLYRLMGLGNNIHRTSSKSGKPTNRRPLSHTKQFLQCGSFSIQSQRKVYSQCCSAKWKKYIEQLANLIDQSVNIPTPVFDKKKSMLREGVQEKNGC